MDTSHHVFKMLWQDIVSINACHARACSLCVSSQGVWLVEGGVGGEGLQCLRSCLQYYAVLHKNGSVLRANEAMWPTCVIWNHVLVSSLTSSCSTCSCTIKSVLNVTAVMLHARPHPSLVCNIEEEGVAWVRSYWKKINTHTHIHFILHSQMPPLPPLSPLHSLVAAKEKAKMEEAGIVDKSSQDSTAEDERFQRHLDSASTLNHGSSSGAMSTTQSYELQPTEVVEGGPSSTSLPVAVLERTATIEEGNSQQVRDTFSYSSGSRSYHFRSVPCSADVARLSFSARFVPYTVPYHTYPVSSSNLLLTFCWKF